MKRFIQRLILFILTATLFLGPLVFIRIGGRNLRYIDNPTAAIIDKNNRLENLESPKIIIAGGSNAFYGLNSAMLEEKLGFNVVNMALFAGFGLDLILEQTVGKIHKGDILILSVEYFLESGIDDRAREEVIQYFPSSYQLIENSQIPVLIRLRNSLKNNIESCQNIVLKPVKKSSPVYLHSRTINKYGDAIGYLNYENPKDRAAFSKLEYRYYEEIGVLNRYAKQVYDNGAQIYFIFPPIPITDFEQNKEIIGKYYSDLKRDLNFPVLCTPEDMAFEDDLFFDTAYHLGKVGRELRTEKIVNCYLAGR